MAIGRSAVARGSRKARGDTLNACVHVEDKEDVPTQLGLTNVFLLWNIVLDQGVMELVQAVIMQVLHMVVLSKDSQLICIQVVHVTVGNTTDIQQVQ